MMGCGAAEATGLVFVLLFFTLVCFQNTSQEFILGEKKKKVPCLLPLPDIFM